MKKLRVISCAVYFLLAAVLLMPCVLALDIKDYSAFANHIWKETGRTESTVHSEGTIQYKCSICGKSRSEVLPKLEIEECTHDWKETDRIRPTETTPGQITYTCSKCGEVRTESIPARSQYDGTFVNWLGSVAGLFDMTLNRILGFNALRLHVGVLVFMAMFSLLVKLIRQGRKGQL